MKKLLIALFLIVVMAGGLAAKSEKKAAEPLKAVSIDLGVGVWEHLYTPGAIRTGDIMAILLGFRAGGFGAFRVNLSDILSVGAEVGFAYMRIPSMVGKTVACYDVPIHAIVRAKFGGVALQPYVGGLLAGRDEALDFNLHAGAKLLLGGFFIDASVVIPTEPGGFNFYPRFGLGFQINDIFSF